MSFYRELVEGIKEIYSERDKPVKIRNFIYQQLLEEAGGEEKIEILLNQILAKRFNLIEEEIQAEKEKQKHEKQLLNYYILLDKYLFATLGRVVEIGITNGLVGKEPYSYTLQDYALSRRYRFLTLHLERNGELYPITFNAIEDIKFSDLRDSLKTWIYMTPPLTTWRFYLRYDQKIIENNIDSGKLEL